jgi:hypothetical protein
LRGARVWRGVGCLAVALALGVRLHNLLSFPPDWGFDATASWRYIYRLSEDRALPHPSAGWATADPPLYFALGAAVFAGLDSAGARDAVVYAVPLLGTLAGLGVVALAVTLVRRHAPRDELRAWLAAGLLLFLPAHVQASVMVNEEALLALWVALALFLLAAPPASSGAQRAAGAGIASGLALLTKLSGALVAAAAGLSYAVEGWRRRAGAPALRCLAALGAAALLAGGWWFARNLAVYGYLQPFAMPAHRVMFGMPPGERGLLDYVSLPLATFTDPQLLNADLLRSVWGSTYATTWFDGHRVFLPRESRAASYLGTATLLLALLPTAAFAAGLWRGARRARAAPGTADLPLLLLSALTLAGYAAYTWRNPWFAVLKGTSLSPLALPFAFWASEALAGWLRRAGAARWLLALALAGLAACAAAASTFDGLFGRPELPGLEWRAAAPDAPR